MNNQNPDFSKEQLTEMPDQKLFKLCQQYGEQARYWRQKFTGLLPEVFRRGLYEKKGFGSIYEFAAKLAGMSRKQVQRVLNLEEKFQSMPILHAALIKGEVSAHKLARVVSIATPENEEDLTSKVKILSQSALEVLVRDEKYHEGNGESGANRGLFEEGIFKSQNGLFKAKNRAKSVRTHTFSELKLDADVEAQLLEMQQKGININELLRGFLQKRKLELAQEKEQLAREQQAKRSAAVQEQKPSRYIPAKIRHHFKQEYGTKCAIPACHKTAQHIHHTARFSLSQNHDPNYLAPLCKAHHELAHAIDTRVQQKRRISLRE